MKPELSRENIKSLKYEKRTGFVCAGLTLAIGVINLRNKSYKNRKN